MKRIFLIAAMMLMVMYQSVWAQSNDDYSLKGLAKTLKQFHVTSLGDFNNGQVIIKVKSGEKELSGVINKQGKIVVPCEDIYLDNKDFIKEGLILYRKNKYGYVDVNGECKIPFQYESANSFSEGLAAVQTEDDEKTYSWRYIDKQGNIVIPPIKGVDKARAFQDGVAYLSVYDRTNECEGIKVINKQGEIMLEKPYRCLGYSNGIFIVRNEKRGSEYRKYGVMNKNGVMVIPTQYNYISLPSEGLLIVENELRKTGYMDMEGKVKIGFQFDDAWRFVNGIALIKQNGKYGFIDKEGRIIIPCRYDNASDFSEGLAAVCISGKWGYINKEGELIISCQYDNYRDFSEGFAVVMKGNQYAMIDKQGKYYIPMGTCDYISSFSEGLAVVKMRGFYGYVDKNGNSTFKYY